MSGNEARHEQGGRQPKISQITPSIISFGSSYCSLGCYKFPPDALARPCATRRADIKFVKEDFSPPLGNSAQSSAGTSESARDGKMVKLPGEPRVTHEIDEVLSSTLKEIPFSWYYNGPFQQTRMDERCQERYLAITPDHVIECKW